MRNKTLFVLMSMTALSSGVSAARADTSSEENDRKRHAPAVSQKAVQDGVQARGTAEEVRVLSAGLRSPTGVTNQTPGGGLLPSSDDAAMVSGANRDFIAKQAPTSNLFSLMQMAPGVTVAKTDPLGVSDRSNVMIRGMQQNEIGWEFEGMPADDQINHVADSSEWSDSENIGHFEIRQGSPDMTAPVLNAVGALVSSSLRDPSLQKGGYIGSSFGTNNAFREFLRLDSGEIGHTGIRNFTSFSYTTNDNWRGPGNNTRYHVDSKFVKEWGNGNRITAVVTYNRLQNAWQNYLTLSQWQQYGTHYNLATSFKSGKANYYELWINRRSRVMISLPSHFNLGHGLSLTATPYYFWMSGSVPNGTTLSNTGSYSGTEPAGNLGLDNLTNGSGVVAAMAAGYTFSSGITTGLAYRTGINLLEVGAWYNNVDRRAITSYAAVGANGQAANLYGGHAITMANGSVLYSTNLHEVQQTTALYVQDTLSLLHDRLKISAGFKEAMVDLRGTNMLPGARYYAGASYAIPLPRMSIHYRFNAEHQIFFDVNTAFRTPVGDTPFYDSISVSTGKVTSHGSSSVKPEYSISEELGYRYTGLFNASIGVFNYNFKNRQLSASAPLNGVLTTQYLNVGGQTTRGAEAEIGLKRWHHISPYASISYLHATIDDNFYTGGTYLPTKGRVAPMSPKATAAVGINYDDSHFFGGLQFNWVDSMYSSFMNDQGIPQRKTLDINAGYRMNNIGFFRKPQIQLNIINAANTNYLSGVVAPVANAKAQKGANGKTIAASTPTYDVGAGFAALVSISAGF